jgi:hypothetical protein
VLTAETPMPGELYVQSTSNFDSDFTLKKVTPDVAAKAIELRNVIVGGTTPFSALGDGGLWGVVK